MDDKDKIFEKWKKLQEIILQEKLLTDALFRSKNMDYADIKKLILDLSEIKYKIRKIMFKINSNTVCNNTKINDRINEDDYETIEYLNEDNELFIKIKKFLFFMHKNIDYILTLLFSISEEKNDNKEIEIDSLIELLLNNFYEEYPLKKGINIKIIIIIYKLFEKEISKMDYINLDGFINSNYVLNKFINLFLLKDEFIIYLNKMLSPIIDSVEKEIEKKDIVNLSLTKIKNNINNNINFNIKNNSIFKIKKNLKENNLNIEDIDRTELIYYIWRNHEQFFNDLSSENLLKRLKNEKNNELKKIIETNSLNLNIYKQNKDFLSNKGLVEVLNNEYFEKNFELIVEEYKYNYLYIHRTIGSFLLELIGKIDLIPKNIRYICKIIYILISAKFPNIPKYSKNSFIGKFIFNKFIFPSLLFENKFIFNNKVSSFETKKCIGEIISALNYANKCMLFKSFNNIEKILINNYILEIIPILDKFYDSLIDIKLPKIIEKLINLKLDEIKKNKTIKKIYKKKFEKNHFINSKNNMFVSEIIKTIKTKKTKNIFTKKNLSWKFNYICFSLKDLLFILSLINNSKNKFLNLPKNDSFNNIFEYLINKQKEIESMMSKNNNNNDKFYIIYRIKKHNYNKLFRNNFQSNKKLFCDMINNSKDLNLAHIKFSIKILLQKLNFMNFSNSNEDFFKLLLNNSLEANQFNYLLINQNKKVPLCWFSKYVLDNIKLLNDKYKQKDYQKLYDELYEDELYNLSILNKFWNGIMIKNEESINLIENYIMNLKSKLDYIQNAFYINQAEKIIFLNKIEVYLTINTKIKKNKKEDENMPVIKIERTKTNNEKEIKINSIKEFINIFSNDFLLPSREQNLKPYDLLNFEIIEGENKYKISESIFKYLKIIKKFLNDNYNEIEKNGINEIITIIKDYILESIYKLVFPKKPTEKDIIFFQKTKELNWITIENFGIKNIELYQIYYPEKLMIKFEESNSLNEKIKYIKYIQKYINDIFLFNTGKEEIGQDESTPFIQYLIIKCQPERIVSNINFIKYFLSKEELLGDKGFLISQIDSAIIFVSSINHTHLYMSEEEFNEKIKNAKTKKIKN